MEIILIGTIGSSVVGLAMVEDRLVKVGKHVEAELLHTVHNFILYGGVLWLLWELFKRLGVFL